MAPLAARDEAEGNTERRSSPPSPPPRHNSVLSIGAGLLTGNTIAVAFNPMDRALYLSVREHRPFFSAENFRAPWRGLSQALLHRTFSHGLYYIFQEELRTQHVHPLVQDGTLSERQGALVVGVLAGATYGLLLNPIAAVKYQLWASDEGSLWRTLRHKWAAGGLRPFVKGTRSSVLRDITFGCLYELLRPQPRMIPGASREQYPTPPGPPPLTLGLFAGNFVAAGCAVAASAPFNYIRLQVYACPPDQTPPSMRQIMRALFARAMQEPTLAGRLRVLQIRLAVGLGTVRSAAGMAVGQILFPQALHALANINSLFKLGFD